MCPRSDEEADWDDEGWDADQSDADRDEDEPTIPCPSCRREIHEDSPRCPHCGHYLSDEDAAARPAPWWIIIGILLGLLAIWTWIAR